MAAGGENPQWAIVQLPIESNPEVMNKYAEKLGLSLDVASFQDILSTEEWALDMVPKPVHAVMMLFPIKDASEAHRAAEAARIAKDGQVVDPQLYYTKQTIGNACGTIGMLHAIANASTLTGGPIAIAKDSWLDTFVTSTLASTPDQRAARLETDGGLEAEHAAVVQEGQSAVVEDTWQHFICFVVKGGHLYELDGRKDGPINHGPSSQDTLLQDAAKVVQKFMERDPGELRFTMVALAAPPLED